ncbi:reticulocalbin-2 isoform X1 [Octopus vulgaris]|uniref:Reticulocalbin-3 n=1 Tax=Octopus vulgaris TaxID=6645 RepID=A0AA36F5I0_OCTVU|nr:reticulocalbin-2 isoform X1 [Octopus vulgaris]
MRHIHLRNTLSVGHCREDYFRLRRPDYQQEDRLHHDENNNADNVRPCRAASYCGAILGSKKAEEEFNELPPDEAKERLTRLIPMMDLNKDGKLVLPELQSWIYNSFKNLDKDEINEEFSSMDTDGDKKVTWEEYVHKFYSYTPEFLKEMKMKGGQENDEILKIIEDDEEKFKVADRNKDGNLDVSEFPAVLHPYDYDFMYDHEIKRALREHDKNGDNKIDLAEYGMDNEMTQSDEAEKIAEKVKFGEFDTNKDGFLDTEEMKPWIIPSTMENSKEEAEHIMGEADTNKDNILTKEEILENFETFVGSQATDYGKHLHLVHEEL